MHRKKKLDLARANPTVGGSAPLIPPVTIYNIREVADRYERSKLNEGKGDAIEGTDLTIRYYSKVKVRSDRKT